ncbi:DNA topoisomerase III [Thalassotalea euphylliae]|uniref:DNA topoisomerase 3 n=1 Tax=Thalassotalea euphylliae TaxID=1655234 RepID=A0A3E0UBK1_9GAMM|nr:DNA topoisomerase III [Thalassotalea euphylliae]REL34210.1 DNA topoisomerase III [Thalassotalea euphylliae]
MKLYIAEKPSLGRAIADVLPKPHKKQQGYIQVGNGDIVTWCIGHILEQAEPEAYGEHYKKWQLEHLPIIPESWQLKPKYKTKSQLTVIRNWLKKANEVIHAGDPDREGQLLVDEVLNYLKLSKTKTSAVKRLLISDLNPAAVKKALSQLKSNQAYMPLSVSALARSRADWLYGINLTRALTIQGGKAGYQGVLSVGRVQTPVLGLVVNRDREIANFVSKPFYEVEAELSLNQSTPNQNTDSQATSAPNIMAKWQPSEACQPYQDEDGRVVVKALAENVVSRIHQQPAKVTELTKQDKQQNAPLPYNLSALQIDAAKRYAMNAKLVLDVCQALYEKHKLITYPRSDCRYLPTEHFSQAPQILAMLKDSQLPLAKQLSDADPKRKSRAWQDSKVGAHHAIIPTTKSPAKLNLNNFEKNVYQLICRQYAAQFFPAYCYQQIKASFSIAGGLFTASTNIVSQLGWKSLFTPSPNSKGGSTKAEQAKSNSNKADDGEQQNNNPALANLTQGQTLFCQQGHLREKQTEPPKHFTDASLLAAMTGIARFVTDKSLKAILKETDGLGTEATRAGIIDLLFKRGFLQRQGKQIHATDAGKGLIDALPNDCTQPDMTARWELSLNQIADKACSYGQFMQPIEGSLHGLINLLSQHLPSSLQGLKSPQKPAYKKRRKTSHRKRKSTV